ncbi:hypothetical protein HTZ84_22335 [Haloterrigena sp. SYSU A558-1]|uniref:Uncharacterized protein n=1 Tax=Haloterrigena gelatinilytica TaxID=2741724 RepID=A0ABX2LMF7_9EURY|nr:hypothetical protein [Haloterrigena gelatinilytica]NUC75006.1 hypothetical protein [Haloterrigena gelatinilytica]
MAGVVQSPDGIVTAECEHCGVVVERDLEQAGLTVAENREIAESVAKNHAHRCPASGEGWSEAVAVDVSIDEMVPAAPRGVESE